MMKIVNLYRVETIAEWHAPAVFVPPDCGHIADKYIGQIPFTVRFARFDRNAPAQCGLHATEFTMSQFIKPSLGRYAAIHNFDIPRHLGTRYDLQGTFLPEPGNTVVCHLVNGSASQRAVIEVRNRMLSMPDSGKLTFTPVSSLHMTLFQGIIEYRRALPYWPLDVPLNTGIDEMTGLYLDRLRQFESLGSFQIKVIDVTPVGLTVSGATSEDDAVIKKWRDALAVPFGYRHPDHDAYVFHVTFAYPVDWLDDDRLPAWQKLLDECLLYLERTASIIEIHPPAFCSFKDMNHFEELLVLGNSHHEASAWSMSK